MRRENLEIVALHAKIAARERRVVAFVLQRYELAHDLALIDRLPLLEIEDHRAVRLDRADAVEARNRSEEHTSELQSLMRISYAVFCLKKKKKYNRSQKN